MTEKFTKKSACKLPETGKHATYSTTITKRASGDTMIAKSVGHAKRTRRPAIPDRSRL
jgi:hypothetical protein